MTYHTIPLRGCTPEPLGNYLKALGVFRLVAEQADSSAVAWWNDGVFWIGTKWSEQDLVDFFLTGVGGAAYAPTPIFAPWGGRPGFYKDGNKEAKSRLARILIHSRNDTRYRQAAETIRAIRAGLRKHGWLATKPKQEKFDLITSSRSAWPECAMDWFDACLAIEEDTRFGFLYGTGGNEGSADITNNFWELIEEMLGFPKPNPDTREMLSAALFATCRAAGTSRTAGQHFPSSSGSYNSGQGFFGSTSTNPWDVILMMEGCVLFAGATTKRLSQFGKGKAAFPFMLDYVATGEPQTTLKDEPKQDAKVVRCRAEFWMPLWNKPSILAELQALLTEGRLQRESGDPAQHSIQAMEAISSLGVTRGIEAFQRVALYERRGKGYYLAASSGIYPVPRQPNVAVSMLAELADFRDQAYRNLREGPGVPERVLAARQRMNASMAEILRGGNQGESVVPNEGMHVLISVSQLEWEVSLLRDKAQRLTPAISLSTRWYRDIPDEPEYRLARSITGIAPWGKREQQGQTVQAVSALRSNLLPLTRRGKSWYWDAKSRSAVWARGASLSENLAAILRRRLIDAGKGDGDGLPLWGGEGAGFSDLLAFWNRQVDEDRLSDLIHALALVDMGNWTAENIDHAQENRDPTPDLHSSAVWFGNDGAARIRTEPLAWNDRELLSRRELDSAFALPRVYSLLKLCFVGGRLPTRPVEGRIARRTGEEPYPPHAPEILNLLQAGRLAEAVEIAARKLRAKGYPPIFDPASGNALELNMTRDDCHRLAGMLLIPVRYAGVLAALAIKPRSANH